MPQSILALLISSLFLFSCTEKPPLAGEGSSGISSSDFVKTISASLDSLGKADAFSGVVAIEKDGELILEKAYGLAHIGHEVPNTPSTKFGFASMGKMFTGVAVLQLVEKGLLDLEATVGTYLPDYPSAVVRDSVTLHHLLTHTSGIPDFLTDQYLNASKGQFRKVADFTRYFENEPMEYSPGTNFIYRNSDYVVLGLIIESVSGQSYFDYVRSHIIEPAGMKDTGFQEWDHPVANRATGYTASTSQPGSLMANHYLISAIGGPFGGGCGTAKDFLSFANSLMSNQLLSPAMTQLAIQGKAADSTYGYGFVDNVTNGHRIVGHSGGNYGVAAELRMFTDLGYNVVVLTNRDAADGFLEVRLLIEAALIGKTPGYDRFFFTRDLIKLTNEEGLDAGLASLEASSILPSGISLNRAGFQFIDGKDFDKGRNLFQVYMAAYPESSDPHDCMGEAYFQEGDLAAALVSFEIALALDPKDPYAIRRIKEIKSGLKGG